MPLQTQQSPVRPMSAGMQPIKKRDGREKSPSVSPLKTPYIQTLKGPVRKWIDIMISCLKEDNLDLDIRALGLEPEDLGLLLYTVSWSAGKSPPLAKMIEGKAVTLNAPKTRHMSG